MKHTSGTIFSFDKSANYYGLKVTKNAITFDNSCNNDGEKVDQCVLYDDGKLVSRVVDFCSNTSSGRYYTCDNGKCISETQAAGNAKDDNGESVCTIKKNYEFNSACTNYGYYLFTDKVCLNESEKSLDCKSFSEMPVGYYWSSNQYNDIIKCGGVTCEKVTPFPTTCAGNTGKIIDNGYNLEFCTSSSSSVPMIKNKIIDFVGDAGSIFSDSTKTYHLKTTENSLIVNSVNTFSGKLPTCSASCTNDKYCITSDGKIQTGNGSCDDINGTGVIPAMAEAGAYTLFFGADNTLVSSQGEAKKAYSCTFTETSPYTLGTCTIINGESFVIGNAGVLTCTEASGCTLDAPTQNNVSYHRMKTKCQTADTVCEEETTDATAGYLYECTNPDGTVACTLVNAVGYYINGNALYTCTNASDVKCTKSTKTNEDESLSCSTNNIGKIVYKTDQYVICTGTGTTANLVALGTEYVIVQGSSDTTYGLDTSKYGIIKASSTSSVINSSFTAGTYLIHGNTFATISDASGNTLINCDNTSICDKVINAVGYYANTKEATSLILCSTASTNADCVLETIAVGYYKVSNSITAADTPYYKCTAYACQAVASATCAEGTIGQMDAADKGLCLDGTKFGALADNAYYLVSYHANSAFVSVLTEENSTKYALVKATANSIVIDTAKTNICADNDLKYTRDSPCQAGETNYTCASGVCTKVETPSKECDLTHPDANCNGYYIKPKTNELLLCSGSETCQPYNDKLRYFKNGETYIQCTMVVDESNQSSKYTCDSKTPVVNAAATCTIGDLIKESDQDKDIKLCINGQKSAALKFGTQEDKYFFPANTLDKTLGNGNINKYIAIKFTEDSIEKTDIGDSRHYKYVFSGLNKILKEASNTCSSASKNAVDLIEFTKNDDSTFSKEEVQA